MKKLDAEDYTVSARYIDPSSCGVVYPYSIAEQIQQGDVFTDSRSALFWHDSGFAFAYGEYDETFLDWIYGTFLSDRSAALRRFILFISDERVKDTFSNRGNIICGRRFFFEFREERSQNIPSLPAGCRLCEIDRELLDKIHGPITPAFSWRSAGEFLQRGKGYCILEGENAAAWAFAAAVSGEEIDIGVETNSSYRQLGLGTIAAQAMVRYTLEQGKRPVWACHSHNIASQKLAYKLGFEKSAECCILKRK